LAKRGNALFKSVCLGKCKSRDLPKRLNLTGIAPEMNRLWDASVRELASGVVREHAALLVWERERLRLTNIVEGADDEVVPEYELTSEQHFVGTFHTYPYVTGKMGIAFSGMDIASAIADGENLSIVHSGNQIAALVRTEFTPKIVDEKAILKHEDELLWFHRDTILTPQTILKINLIFCKQYNLGYYLGNITGQLRLRFQP